MMKASINPLVAGLVLAAAFILINALADRGLTGVRLDLTEDRLHTVTNGTKQVLRDLEEPVTLRLFFSEELAAPYPSVFTYGRRVKDLLREYEAIAGDKIRLEIIDPEPFSEAEDDAVGYGLQGVPVDDGTQLFFGLAATDTTDGEGVIAFFNQEREQFLEYDLTKLIYELSLRDRPQVAMVAGAGFAGSAGRGIPGLGPQPRPAWAAHDQLAQLFDLNNIGQDFDRIPEQTDLLLLVHPTGLTDDQLYAIDQFALGGGNVLAFIDPFAEVVAESAQRGMPGAGENPTSDMGPLLLAWGLEMTADQLVGDVELAQRVNFGGGGPRAVKDYVLWLGLGPDYINRDDVVTGALDLVTVATAGALQTVDGASTTISPLLRSSQVSSLLDSALVQGQPDPDQLMAGLIPDDAVYTLAARVTGRAATAFPDRAGEGHRDTGDINAIVVADVDMLEDRFWVQVQQFFGQRLLQPFADNGSFIVNAVDNMTGSDALISLRSRGVSRRPFEVVEDLRKAAEARFLERENALQQELAETEAQLAELEAQRPQDGSLLTPEQSATLEQFRARALDIRKQLREVQRDLRRDIDALEDRLAFINIALVPIILCALALVLSLLRRRRRKMA